MGISEKTLKNLRIQMAEDPKFSVEDALPREAGKSYEISGEMEFVGAFQKNERIKVLARLYNYEVHEDIIEEALQVFEDELINRVNELVSDTGPEEVDVYLADAVSREDIDEACSEYRIKQ